VLLKCNPTFPLTLIKVITKIKHFTVLNLVLPSELTSFQKLIFTRIDVLPLSHWCSVVLVVIFHVAPEDSSSAWAEERDTEKGCATVKLLFPTDLCVTITEPKPHLVKRTSSLKRTA